MRTSLGAVCGKGVYGLVASAAEEAVGPKFLRTTDMIDGDIDWASVPYCVVDDKKQAKCLLQHGDLVISRTGANAGAAAYVSMPPDGAVFAGYLVRFRADPQLADSRFLGYVLQSQLWADYVTNTRTGSAQPQLNAVLMGKFEFDLPPLDEQRRIAEVLGALDDLIDTNERLIRDLVVLLDSEFDRRFGEAALGLSVGDLGAVVDCLHSKKPERDPAGTGLLLQLNNIRDDGLLDPSVEYLISDADYSRWSKNLETRPHDLVVTNVGRVGAVARVPSGVKAALGRNMTAIRMHDAKRDAPFVATALLSPIVRREIASKTDTGTILDALNVRSIPKLRLPSASDDDRANYSTFAAPLMEECDALMLQNIELRQTRDELLPLLMSGAVRVRAEGVAA